MQVFCHDVPQKTQNFDVNNLTIQEIPKSKLFEIQI